jgi:pimeloyl-ACP methyl ester carboxylesterase
MNVHVNGVDLGYVEEGKSVPVVFSHGGSSDLRYWEPQRAAFAARYRFVAYSDRFHGIASWPATGDYSADANSRDLAIIRRLEAGAVHLVGFSTAIALHELPRPRYVQRSRLGLPRAPLI